MISILIFCQNKQLADELHSLCSYNVALMSNEQLIVWKYDGVILKLQELNNQSKTPDFIIYEVKAEKDVKELDRLRGLWPEAEIMIIASLSISPEYYLTPYIRPIMFMPYNCDRIKRKARIHELFVYYFEKRMKAYSGDKLVIDVNGRRRYLAYNHIICLEACEKKIKVYYNQEQLSFYGSLKQLEIMLPPNFVRCHRSYIVNSVYISEMNHKRSELILADELVIPLSKKFKNKMIHRLGKEK